MDKMHCLTGTHEVFSEKGWINIKDITTDIKVLTLNNNTESFNYPTKIHKYEEDGNNLRTLFYVKNENIDTIMTEGHRVFVDNKLIPINELDRVNNTIYSWKSRTGTFTVNLTTDCEIYESGDGVYCLSVPGEIFYVRRNNKEFWTGNSRARGPITMLTHQPPEGKNIAHVYVIKDICKCCIN
jgi:archaellum component FlaG (FlaF/FlaG flagellin family)